VDVFELVLLRAILVGLKLRVRVNWHSTTLRGSPRNASEAVNLLKKLDFFVHNLLKTRGRKNQNSIYSQLLSFGRVEAALCRHYASRGKPAATSAPETEALRSPRFYAAF
ncbi:MAG: hypothetical protein ACRD2O_07405, partial [Terriglobia bacterium]